jgi:hypothetical protein
MPDGATARCCRKQTAPMFAANGETMKRVNIDFARGKIRTASPSDARAGALCRYKA